MKDRIPLGLGQLLADGLMELAKDYCMQSVIAGSIRRGEETVGDIELVILTTKYSAQSAFFGESTADETPIDDMVRRTTRMASYGWRIGEKNGFRYKQLQHTQRKVTADLFIITDERAWGSAIAVRTGPVFFSKSMMTRAKQLDMHFANGFLLYNHPWEEKDEHIIPLRTERSAFDALKIKWLPPDRRRSGLKALTPKDSDESGK